MAELIVNADARSLDSEVLILDPDTRADLQLFGSDSEPDSLFEFCNRCRTDGGESVLEFTLGAISWWAYEDHLYTKIRPDLPLALEGKHGRLRSNYVLHRGVSAQRLGMRVLREEGVFDLLDGILIPE